VRWINEWTARHPYGTIFAYLLVLSLSLPFGIIAMGWVIHRIVSPTAEWQWQPAGATCSLGAHSGVQFTLICGEAGSEVRHVAALAGVSPVTDPQRRQEIDAFVEELSRARTDGGGPAIRCQPYVGVPSNGVSPPTFVHCTHGEQSVTELLIAGGRTAAAPSTSPAMAVLPAAERQRVLSSSGVASDDSTSRRQIESWLATLYGLLAALGGFLINRARAAVRRKGLWLDGDRSIGKFNEALTKARSSKDPQERQRAIKELEYVENTIRILQSEQYDPSLSQFLNALDVVKADVANGHEDPRSVETLLRQFIELRSRYA
jgi:hypothetical protein